MSGNSGKRPRGIVFEPEHASGEFNFEQFFGRGEQGTPAPAFAQQLDAKENLRFCDGSCEEFCRRLICNPGQHRRVGLRLHQL